MTTKLTLVAPPDLSVGQLRITEAGDQARQLTVTPLHRELVAVEIAPGVRTAVIEPLGLRPRTFLFNVVEGQENRVELPPLSFLAVGPQMLSSELLEALSRGSQSEGSPARRGDDLPDSPAGSGPPPATIDIEVTRAAPGERALHVGFSEDHSPYRMGGWQPYRHAASVQVELIDGRLELVIPRDEQLPGATGGGRLRVELLFEGNRAERAMVPLFAGGTRVVLQASALSLQDLDMVIVPVDPFRRALTQALRAGAEEDARAIAADYVSGWQGATLEDPWTDILVALLAVRFPLAFPQDKFGLSDAMADRYPWISDVHILRARDTLMAAADANEAKADAAEQAVDHFRKARRTGAPYFANSNQLAMELLAALSDQEFPEQTANLVKWMYTRWTSDERRQRKAGTSFSWVTERRDMHRPRKLSAAELTGKEAISESYDELADAPVGRPSFNSRFVASVFTGQLSAGSITPASPPPPSVRHAASNFSADPPPTSDAPPSKIRAPKQPVSARTAKKGSTKVGAKSSSRPRPKSAMDPPALARPIRHKDDPQRRRFGERDRVDNFQLQASFDWDKSDRWVKITMQVVAVGDQPPSFDRVVEFFLHDTFNPDRLRAVFRGDGASISIHAWGGFTVGAWLPEERIELELNLAEVPGAPYSIKHF